MGMQERKGVGEWARMSLSSFARCLVTEWTRRRGRRIGGYLVFVAVALVLWYLHKLSSEYTLTFDMPVAFDQLPQGVVLEGGSERSISVRVRGHGYSLLKYKYLGWLSPYEVDLRDAWHGLPTDSTGAHVLYRPQLSAIVAGKLPSGLMLDAVVSDTIRLQYGVHAQGYRRVHDRLAYRVAPQHVQVGPVRVKPDSVLVSGTDIALQRLEYLTSVLLDLGELHATAEGVVPLEQQGGLAYSTDRVAYSIPISRYTECRLTLPVELEGVPDSLRATVLPAAVQLLCNVPLDHYAGLSVDSFRVVAHYASHAAGSQVLLRLARVPAGVFGVDFMPKHASVYVERIMEVEDANWNHRPNRQWQELRGY